jgi:hypothetical protein
MSDDNKIRVAKALLQGRLHQAVGDKRCGCGPCAHQIAMAARRAGVRRDALEAALLPVARPEPRHRRPRPSGRVRIAESCTIRVRGDRAEYGDGLAILLERLHRDG